MPPIVPGQKIVHLLATVHHGGAERVVLDLARRQRELGADARVVCLQQLGDLQPAFEAAGVPVELVGGRPFAGALGRAWHTAGVLRAANAAVVHTHNAAPQIAAGIGQWLRRWRGRDTVLIHTEHGRLHDVRPSLLRWRRLAAREFDAILAVSADAREQLLEHGIRTRRGVDVVLNGVDLDAFRPRDATTTPGSRVVHVGRLSRIKGQDVLVAAMPGVRRAIPSVRLTIVGDGPSRPALEAQARELGVSDIIEFAGAAEDVRQYLQDADLFVLPSRSEGISIALLEAMACGLAVVATAVGGNREVIDTDTTGTLVPSEEPEALAVAMVAMLSQPDTARAAGRAARHVVETRFAHDHAVTEYATQYERARAMHGAPALRSAA